MADKSIVFAILAKDQASSKFDKVGRSAERSGGKVSKMGGLAKAGALGLAGAAVVAGKAMFGMAQAAAEDAASAKRLETTLKNSTGATDGQVAATEKWIEAQGKSLGVADDQLRPALEHLARATGDVGKAQGLASLAMDVSAGTGKSLESVSMALAKAQNGNVGALGRLGIATKDASGKTKSFDQITKELAGTFKGQASAQAETAAGKFQRLKVQMGEAAEKIGAKLLPILLRMAEWFLEDGIPAMEAFGRGVKTVWDGVMAVFRFAWNNAIQPVMSALLRVIGGLMTTWGRMLRALSKVPGFGWAKGAGDKMLDAGKKATGMADNIKKIPPKTEPKVNAKVEGKDRVDALRTSLDKLPKNVQVNVTAATNAAIGAINDLVGSLATIPGYNPRPVGRAAPAVTPRLAGGADVAEFHIHLEGETIVRSVRARNRRLGVQTAGV